MAERSTNFIVILIAIIVGIAIGFIGGTGLDSFLEGDCRDDCQFEFQANREKCKGDADKERCELFVELLFHKCQSGCTGLF